MSFLSKGKEKEEQFASLFKNYSLSSKEQDIKEHWDVKIEFKVDVKGLKKIKRSDSKPNEFYHFIELLNVKGEKGWLYGEADYFAFETEDYWVLVSQQDLIKFIEKRTEKKTVLTPDDSLYKIYRREGRKDKITMVKTIDLMSIATKILIKVNNNYEST